MKETTRSEQEGVLLPYHRVIYIRTVAITISVVIESQTATDTTGTEPHAT